MEANVSVFTPISMDATVVGYKCVTVSIPLGVVCFLVAFSPV